LGEPCLPRRAYAGRRVGACGRGPAGARLWYDMRGWRYGAGVAGHGGDSDRGGGRAADGAAMVVRADDPAYLARCEREAEALARSRSSGAGYALREGYEELDLLLGIVCDRDMPIEERIKAADKLAPYRHGKRTEPVVTMTFDLNGFLEQMRVERERLVLGKPGEGGRGHSF
jgi:hypothetical protein